MFLHNKWSAFALQRGYWAQSTKFNVYLSRADPCSGCYFILKMYTTQMCKYPTKKRWLEAGRKGSVPCGIRSSTTGLGCFFFCFVFLHNDISPVFQKVSLILWGFFSQLNKIEAKVYHINHAKYFPFLF